MEYQNLLTQLSICFKKLALTCHLSLSLFYFKDYMILKTQKIFRKVEN